MPSTFKTLHHQVKETGQRLDKYLAEKNLATSRSESAKWIKDQLVQVNGHLPKPSYVVEEGDEIIIQKPSLKILDLKPKKINFEIIYEDKEILVLNKPAGLVVHPGAGNFDESLVHGLLYHCQGQLSGIGGVERPGIVHRLDKGTSGLMVVAKTDRAHHNLSQQFQDKTVKKEYHALVLGAVQKNTQRLVNLIKRSEINRKKFIVNQKKGKQAISTITVLQKTRHVSYVAVHIETGRTHQVRVHLSFLGHPILGDETYGGTKKLVNFSEEEKDFIRGLKRPLLQACVLEFYHPVTKEKMTFSIPEDQTLLKAKEMFL